MRLFLLLLTLSLSLLATTHSAKVIEHLESGGYSYIKVQEAQKTYWIAMTQRAVKEGATVQFNEQGWMQNFHSKTLNRTFDNILFASDVSMPSTQKKVAQAPDVMKSKYQQKGTISIAELFTNRAQYAGKKVSIRAEVTKTSSGIMKRNWVHLQDGSRFKGQNDLVFTTKTSAPNKGDVVIAEGIVTVDKDFGYGYFYSVIVEESHFIKAK